MVLFMVQRQSYGFTKVLLRAKRKSYGFKLVLRRVQRNIYGFKMVLLMAKRKGYGFTLVLLRTPCSSLLILVASNVESPLGNLCVSLFVNCFESPPVCPPPLTSPPQPTYNPQGGLIGIHIYMYTCLHVYIYIYI